MEQIKVGYLASTYPYKRNIINILDDVNYLQVTDINKIITFPLKVLHKIKLYKYRKLFTNFSHSFFDFNLNQVDLLHFFNIVSFGSTPWISTFETFLPRYFCLLNHQENGIVENLPDVHQALMAISHNSCKRLIAISKCTLKFQVALLNRYPKYKEKIEPKLCVLHPPQKLFVNTFEEKGLPLDAELSFIFVGRLFFRKGGLEILRAFQKLRNKYNLPINLTIISTMQIGDDASKAGKNEYNIAKKLLINNQEWITYYHSLPNSDVLALMKKCHIGLLPTWADTYGYSVLEMQANGCPVISTDIRALPEINDDTKGWLINVPKNSYGEALYLTDEMRERLSHIIQEQLEKIILEIMNNRLAIIEKSFYAIKNIEENHSLDMYSSELLKIYETALRN